MSGALYLGGVMTVNRYKHESNLLRISAKVMEDRQCIGHSALIIQIIFPSDTLGDYSIEAYIK